MAISFVLNKNKRFLPSLFVRVGGRRLSRSVRGATAAAAQQRSLCVSGMSPMIRISAAVTLILRGSYHRVSQL